MARGENEAVINVDPAPGVAPMLGILAGMGPRSTAPFINHVVEACAALGARADDEFPRMMILSWPTPFRVDFPIDHGALHQAISEGILRLAATGVDLIALPCNVAHLFFDQLVEATSIPILNMVESAVGSVPAGTKRVAILGAAATIEASLYQDALSSRGLTYAGSYQTAATALLRTVKQGTPPTEANGIWRELLGEMAGDGVECAILASTDLSVLADPGEQSPVAIVDSGRSLAVDLVERWHALIDPADQ